MIVLVSSTVKPSRHFVIRYFIMRAKVFKPTNKINLCQRSTSAILEILALDRLHCSSENNTTSGFDVRPKLSDEWLKPAVPSLIGFELCSHRAIVLSNESDESTLIQSRWSYSVLHRLFSLSGYQGSLNQSPDQIKKALHWPLQSYWYSARRLSQNGIRK